VKVYHGLDFTEHQHLAAQLVNVRAQLVAVQAEVQAGYGRSDGKAKLVQKLVEHVDLLRGHLSHSLLSEHSDRPTRELSQLYYPDPGA
jgi:hypothetical protein